jgi:four helix bundle protein
MRTNGFQGLAVYRQSAALADAVREAVLEWNSVDRWTVGIQLIRAADSIGANIAEATGRWSHADQIRMLFIARGSSYELQHWMARAKARKWTCPPGAANEADTVGRMLNGLIAALKSGRVKHL